MERFTEQLRRAILHDGRSRYAISRESGIDEAVLSRFVRGERGLSSETIDVLMEFLGLGLEIRPRRKARGRKSR
jgi:hypothetical protein